MGTTITNLYVTHNVTATVESDVRAAVETYSLIPDGTALAIASWFAAPRGTGAVFASISTSAVWDTDDALDAIDTERADHTDPMILNALDALARWVESLVSDYGRCPACGEPIDYCQGHGSIGDPAGRAILDAHDDGDHTDCHPDGCDDAPGTTDRPGRFA